MSIVGLAILALIAFWLLGGIVLRLGGLFVIFLMLFGLTSGTAALGGAWGAVLWLLIGAAMWLAGHWHFALRHGYPKSLVAELAFQRLTGPADTLGWFGRRLVGEEHAQVRLPAPRSRSRDGLDKDESEWADPRSLRPSVPGLLLVRRRGSH